MSPNLSLIFVLLNHIMSHNLWPSDYFIKIKIKLNFKNILYTFKFDDNLKSEPVYTISTFWYHNFSRRSTFPSHGTTEITLMFVTSMAHAFATVTYITTLQFETFSYFQIFKIIFFLIFFSFLKSLEQI